MSASASIVSHSPVLPLLIALLTASLTLLSRRSLKLIISLSLLGTCAYVASIISLLFSVQSGPLVYQFSAWPAPYGISFVADSFALLLLCIAAIVTAGVLVYSITTVDESKQKFSYHSLLHFMLFGATGALLTGDLFNLFVWFEVTLMTSYVLVTFYSTSKQTKAGMTYVILNLIGGAFMLISIGGIYATTGTLNLADLSHRLSQPDLYNISMPSVMLFSMILFVVFALKSGLVPLHFWVPIVYQAAPSPISALLSGVVKKVGLYAMIRIFFTVFPSGDSTPLGELSILTIFGISLFILSAASIIFGGISALSQDNIDNLLAYSSISQMGFIMLPLSLAALFPSIRQMALIATIILTLNHSLAKASLFLASGCIKNAIGSANLSDLGGLSRHSPILSISVFVSIFSLVGLPPIFGFFGKLHLLILPLNAEPIQTMYSSIFILIILAGTVLSFLYAIHLWNTGFWGEISSTVSNSTIPAQNQYILLFFTLLLIFFGIGFESISPLIESASHSAIDSSGYIEAVLYHR